MDRGAWWASVHGRKELDMTEGLTFHLIFLHVCIYTHTYKLYIYIHTNIHIHQAIHYSVCKRLLDYFKFLKDTLPVSVFLFLYI